MPKVSFTFVNRKEELATVCRAASPRFVLVDGAAGFGKTCFLEQVKSTYESQVNGGWKGAVVDLKVDPQVGHEDANIARPALARAIVRAFRSRAKAPVFTSPDLAMTAGLLAPFLVGQSANILLLFDNIHALQADTSAWLRDLVAELDKGLKAASRTLRVIFAGRYVRAWSATARPPYELAYLELSPFRLAAVNDMVDQTETAAGMSGCALAYKEELAWWVLLLSGGHPGAICSMLGLICHAGFVFPNLGFAFLDREFERRKRRGTLFGLCVEPIIADLLPDVPRSLQEVLQVMSPIRCFNAELLYPVLNTNGVTVPDINAAWTHLVELRKAALIRPPTISSPMYSDQIMSRMLAMRLLLTRPEFSRQIVESAQTVFDDWACAPWPATETQKHRAATLESLYLLLQLDFIEERLAHRSGQMPAGAGRGTLPLLKQKLSDYRAAVKDPDPLFQLADAFNHDEELKAWITWRAGPKAVDELAGIIVPP